jgi:hypothetical protein
MLLLLAVEGLQVGVGRRRWDEVVLAIHACMDRQIKSTSLTRPNKQKENGRTDGRAGVVNQSAMELGTNLARFLLSP